jgi:hypothetical protein
MEQAERVAIWVAQSGFAPEPGLVDRHVLETEAGCWEVGYLLIEVFALEVDGRGGRRDRVPGFERQSAVAVWTGEPRIPRASDDLL